MNIQHNQKSAKLDNIVEAVKAKKPWRGILYGIHYPIKRYPLTAFIIPTWWMFHSPYTLLIFITIALLIIDIKFRKKHSLDLGKNENDFIEKICNGELIHPPHSEKIKKYFRMFLVRVALVFVVLSFLFFIYQKYNFTSYSVVLWNSTSFDIFEYILRLQETLAVIFGGVIVYFSAYYWPAGIYPGKNYQKIINDDKFDKVEVIDFEEFTPLSSLFFLPEVWFRTWVFHPLIFTFLFTVLSFVLLLGWALLSIFKNNYPSDMLSQNSFFVFMWLLYIISVSNALGMWKVFWIARTAKRLSDE